MQNESMENWTVDYIDSVDVDRREIILKKAVLLEREQKQKRKMSPDDLRRELQLYLGGRQRSSRKESNQKEESWRRKTINQG